MSPLIWKAALPCSAGTLALLTLLTLGFIIAHLCTQGWNLAAYSQWVFVQNAVKDIFSHTEIRLLI